jgi:hypothetical protein
VELTSEAADSILAKLASEQKMLGLPGSRMTKGSE